MPMDDTSHNFTVGKTKFYQGENQTQPFFCSAAG